MTEWVEGHWDSVSGGDPVQLRKEGATGDAVLEDRAGATSSAPHAWNLYGLSRYKYEAAGWSLFVEAPPVPQLPEGFYTVSGMVYEIRNVEPRVRCLSHDRGWQAWHHYRHSPFTRLEPVADVAKRVLDRVLEIHSNENRFTSDIVRDVAAEFGASS